jgi:hypothetical protein
VNAAETHETVYRESGMRYQHAYPSLDSRSNRGLFALAGPAVLSTTSLEVGVDEVLDFIPGRAGADVSVCCPPRLVAQVVASSASMMSRWTPAAAEPRSIHEKLCA